MEKTEYPKINSLYKRDPEKGNNIILEDFSLPEFFLLERPAVGMYRKD